mmetsp:Transcript_2991/g.2713  ORF Transcript_2991/g.2713 Transcript_2991/m.2713 type:complete len:100 (-) Transcript_2991:871-1170(-)
MTPMSNPETNPSSSTPEPISPKSSPEIPSIPLSAPIKKKKKKAKKGLLIASTVAEGLQLLGSGKETTVVNVKSIPIELPKVSTFRLDIRNKPKFVPLKY